LSDYTITTIVKSSSLYRNNRIDFGAAEYSCTKLNRASFTTKPAFDSWRIPAGPVGGIIALVLVKGFKKIFGKKTMLLKIQILQINDYYA
jgi:hypothetical protein